jgi:hypothetical protein
MKWWHKWRYRKWEWRWLTAVGTIEDIKRGDKSVLMTSAVFDRFQAEAAMRHHARKGDLDHPSDAAAGDRKP